MLGYEQFDEAFMTKTKARYDALIERFGRVFARDYGWAVGLPGVSATRPSFYELERLAQVSHLRGHYRWASHEVHPDAAGAEQNMIERGGVVMRLSGATNVGLAEPGHMAVISLHQTHVSLVTAAVGPSPRDLLFSKSVQLLVDETGAAFVRGEESVQAAEERLQERLARRGTRKWQKWPPRLIR